MSLDMKTIIDGMANLEQAAADNFSRLDGAVSGVLSVDCTAGGTVELTKTQGLDNYIVVLTGTPGAGFNLDLPAFGKAYGIRNTSGQTATVRVVGGPGATAGVANNDATILFTDAVNVYAFGSGAIVNGASVNGGITGKVRSTTNQSPATGSWQTLTFDTEDWDLGGLIDLGTNNDRIGPFTSTYNDAILQVTGFVEFENFASGDLAGFRLVKWNNTPAVDEVFAFFVPTAGGFANNGYTLTGMVRVNTDDYIRFETFLSQAETISGNPYLAFHVVDF